ncbi:hemerythrin HHE cation binding domain protein [bacterium BMS3Abin03]|nr:hemerythrin HHE cation binding domain protein [bacterium BMS3Abin03]HDZ59041.1 hemerythrin [Ignavibacteriales bacterium]
MTPTELLKQEHRSIEEMLQVMEAVCKKLESGEQVSTDDLNNIVEFIKVFADKAHHGKEEDLLFVAMVDAGIPKEGGPVGMMLMEHDMGRNFVKGMGEAIQEYSSGNKEAATKIIENARNYASLLSNHIYKEDNILYPMADMHLSEDKQNELLGEFNIVQSEKIGNETYTRLLDTLNELKEKYLS